jgi:arsenate reductase (glutaredoxin)
MDTVTIWHNPHCSKSRKTLELLQERNTTLTVREYLKDPPTESELAEVLTKLGIPARALLRTSEDAYKTLGLSDLRLTEQERIAAMAAHPKLIERPVVIVGERAVLGRPPEAVLSLLEHF